MENERQLETLEDRLKQLEELKTEVRKAHREYDKKTKHVIDSIKGLENIITDEVIKLGHSVTVGNIKAEYIPTVKIRIKKVSNGK